MSFGFFSCYNPFRPIQVMFYWWLLSRQESDKRGNHRNLLWPNRCCFETPVNRAVKFFLRSINMGLRVLSEGAAICALQIDVSHMLTRKALPIKWLASHQDVPRHTSLYQFIRSDALSYEEYIKSLLNTHPAPLFPMYDLPLILKKLRKSVYTLRSMAAEWSTRFLMLIARVKHTGEMNAQLNEQRTVLQLHHVV